MKKPQPSPTGGGRDHLLSAGLLYCAADCQISVPARRLLKYIRFRIFTSSWFTTLPPAIQKIGISRATPRGYPAGYRIMRELAPGPWFNSVSPAEYHRRFIAQLAVLDARAVMQKLHDLGAGRDVALLCYEAPTKPAAWCHRGQVAAWLFDRLGIEVFEFHRLRLAAPEAAPRVPIRQIKEEPYGARSKADRSPCDDRRRAPGAASGDAAPESCGAPDN